MKTSQDRILTTHVGSLPGRGAIDTAVDVGMLKSIIAQQKDVGVDIANEGEYTKGGDWLTYIEGRLGGFEADSKPSAIVSALGKDREVFADFYKYQIARGALAFATATKAADRRTFRCVGPITYATPERLQADLDMFRAAIGDDTSEYFFTTTAPASFEPYHTNSYYASTEEFLGAMGEALRVEYEMIAKAGFLVQVDDAWLVALWDRIGMQMGLEAFKKFCMLRVEVLNHALRNIPEDRIRYHLCWGSWHGPHAYDIPLRDIVDVMLAVKAQGYSIEGANARHEHEYLVWKDVKLPDHKILLPGVVAHATDVVEHPELVSLRIQRYADVVGRERVIASTDCGFGERTHPQIAWAKTRALVEGAALASKALYSR